MQTLEKFSLDNKQIELLLYKKPIVNTRIEQEHKNVKDTMFWLFYNLYNKDCDSYPDYETETKIKFNVIDNFKKNIFKSFKIKREDIENDLIYKKIISVIGFVSLCIHYNINCILIYKKTYYIISLDDSDINHFPILNLYNFKLEKNVSFKEFYKIPSLYRSILPINNYKLTELKSIAKINNVPVDGKKSDIYEALKKEINVYINL